MRKTVRFVTWWQGGKRCGGDAISHETWLDFGEHARERSSTCGGSSGRGSGGESHAAVEVPVVRRFHHAIFVVTCEIWSWIGDGVAHKGTMGLYSFGVQTTLGGRLGSNMLGLEAWNSVA